MSAPNDHARAGPDCGVVRFCGRSVCNGRPGIGCRIVGGSTDGSGPAAPNDHARAGPDGGMRVSRGWGVHGGNGGPGIGCRIVGGSGVDRSSSGVHSSPNDHARSGPDGSGHPSSHRGVHGGNGGPGIGCRIVGGSGIEMSSSQVIRSPPDNHARSGPDGMMQKSRHRGVHGGNGGPGIGCRIVGGSGIEIRRRIGPSPDDQAVSGPDGRMSVSHGGGVHGGDGSPYVRIGQRDPLGIIRNVRGRRRGRRDFGAPDDLGVPSVERMSDSRRSRQNPYGRSFRHQTGRLRRNS